MCSRFWREQQEFPQMEDPYYPLREFFRLCSRSPVTLTFSDIEEIIGDRLDWEAYFCERGGLMKPLE